MDPRDLLFDQRVWEPALKKFGAVTHLTVALYDMHERVVCGPVPSTPLFALFEEFGFSPGIWAECARRCLAQAATRPAVVIAPTNGLAVVGTSLVLEGKIVGAAVAGYALVDFSQSSAIAVLARHAKVPFSRLWAMARQQQPIPQRRLVLHGELLQVLGDSLLRENLRTRQYEDTAGRLKTEMAAKDEFLAVLSHELRTPLTPILGWVRILRDAGDNPTERRKAVISIERNAQLQLKLVEDLLDLNRVIRDKVPLDLAIVDVIEILRSTLDTMAETAAQKKIKMSLLAPTYSLPVEADTGRLQQVFMNVLSNAVKFTPANGTVQVIVERALEKVVVRITDTGEGVEPAFLPHVFTMFRQQEEGTRRRHSGLGVGLALVKRLVEMHLGEVGITSGGLGKGACVTIHLPLAAQTLPIQRPKTTFADLTILVVEDTEDSLDAMRSLLETLGAAVLVARNGMEALDVMRSNNPDLVLCDLRMPLMDGFEFLSELNRIQGSDHPPVVAVSGLASPADHQRTSDAGFDGHLNKPFDDNSLVAVVRSGLRHRRAG